MNSQNNQNNQKIINNYQKLNDEQRDLFKQSMGEEKFQIFDTEMKKLHQNQSQNQNQEQKKDEITSPTPAPDENNSTPTSSTVQASKDFDSSRFVKENKDVMLQVGKEKETGRPDYEDDSDERQKEIVNNLNAYRQDNPELFSNREDFNKNFSYQKRSKAQRDLFDSFRKKKENENKIKGYNTAEEIIIDNNNAEITPDQFDILKKNNPELFAEYEKKIKDEVNLRIVNQKAPIDTVNPMDHINKVVEKSKLQTSEKDLEQIWDKIEKKYWILEESNKINGYSDRLTQKYDEINRERERIQNETQWSAAYVQAKIQKALAPLYTEAELIERQRNFALQKRNSTLAVAKTELWVSLSQTAENQRVFENQLKNYWFALKAINNETPEEKRQAELQMIESKNALSVENKKDLLELTESFNNPDMNSKKPKQQRKALNKALSWYYQKYWDIIKRSQQQVVDDIIKYAKDNNVSIWEALTKNFIEPLQWKTEYKNVVNTKFGIGISKNWNINISRNHSTSIPTINSTKEDKISYIKEVVALWGWSLEDIAYELEHIPDGTSTMQCGQFVNYAGEAMGNNPRFWNTLKEKLTKKNSETPEIWSFVIMDMWTKEGHVGIVTEINDDWTITITDSNWNWDEKKLTHKLSTEEMKKVKGYKKWEVAFNDYKEELSSLYNRFNDKTWKQKLTSSDYKYIEKMWISASEFTKQALSYKKAKDQEMTPFAKDLMKQLYELKDMTWLDYKGAWANLPRTKGAYYRSVYDRVLSSSALQKLIDLKSQWATFGALSDNELNFITNAATNLKLTLGKDDFDNVLTTMIANLEKWISGVDGENTLNLDLSSEKKAGTNHFDVMKKKYWL